MAKTKKTFVGVLVVFALLVVLYFAASLSFFGRTDLVREFHFKDYTIQSYFSDASAIVTASSDSAITYTYLKNPTGRQQEVQYNAAVFTDYFVQSTIATKQSSSSGFAFDSLGVISNIDLTQVSGPVSFVQQMKASVASSYPNSCEYNYGMVVFGLTNGASSVELSRMQITGGDYRYNRKANPQISGMLTVQRVSNNTLAVSTPTASYVVQVPFTDHWIPYFTTHGETCAYTMFTGEYKLFDVLVGGKHYDPANPPLNVDWDSLKATLDKCTAPLNSVLAVQTFQGGRSIKLSDLASPTGFCPAHGIIVTDSSSYQTWEIVSPYVELQSGRSVAIPTSQTWTLFYFSSSASNCGTDKGYNVNTQSCTPVFGVVQLCEGENLGGGNCFISAQQYQAIQGQLTQLTGTLEAMRQQVAALQGKISQQAALIDSYNLTVQQQALLISGLTKNIADQAAIISQMQNNVAEKAAIIKNLESTSQSQAALIAKMNVEISTKAGIIQQLTAKTEEQFSLIRQMQVSFADQGQLVLQLNQSNARMLDYIRQSDASVAQQAEYVAQLKLKNDEMAGFIQSQNLKIAEQAEFIANLKLSNAQQEDIAKKLYSNVQDQQQLIQEINKKNAELESQASNLSSLLQVKGENSKALVIGIIIIMASAIAAVIILRRRKKR